MRLPAVATVLLLLLSSAGCVKELSSEERLDRETQYLEGRDTPDAAALAKVNCDDTLDVLNQARNVTLPESDRLMRYRALYTSLVNRNATFDEEMARNPDLHYTEGNQKLVAARESCVEQMADVRVEFDTYVRELVDVPTVQELKGGNTVTVARLDFTTLRQAIETLNPEDKEQLLTRVDGAEKRVASPAAPQRPTPPGSWVPPR
jgi:hypothetical protein